MLSMITSSNGFPPPGLGSRLPSLGTLAIALTTSIPSITFPNAAYCPSRKC